VCFNSSPFNRNDSNPRDSVCSNHDKALLSEGMVENRNVCTPKGSSRVIRRESKGQAKGKQRASKGQAKGKVMTIKHIRSSDTWLVSKGRKILYRGRVSPWRSPRVIEVALRRDGLRLVA